MALRQFAIADWLLAFAGSATPVAGDNPVYVGSGVNLSWQHPLQWGTGLLLDGTTRIVSIDPATTSQATAGTDNAHPITAAVLKLGALPSSLATTAKTLIPAINEVSGVAGAAVQRAGDQMTGALGAPSVALATPSGGNLVSLDANAGFTRQTNYTTAALSRWTVGVGNGAESGANAGSDWGMNAYADNGSSLLGQWLSIARATGAIAMPGAITSGDLTANSLTTANNITGSGLTLTGTALISNSSGGSLLSIRSNAGNAKMTNYQSGISLRWTEGVIAGAESGSNAGSNWALVGYSDTQTLLGTWFAVTRSSGAVSMPGAVTVGSLTTSGTITPATLTTTGAIKSGGALSIPTVATVATTTYTVAAGDVAINLTGSATCTLTLPAASANAGRILKLKTAVAFTAISASSNVVPAGSVTAGTAILAATAGKWCELISDGVNWQTMAQG